jgi:hypothetical protein
MTASGRRRVVIASLAVAVVLALGGVVAATTTALAPWVIWAASFCVAAGNLAAAFARRNSN